MDFQEIVIYLALVVAVFFLGRKFFLKKKKNDCGNDNCGCN